MFQSMRLGPVLAVAMVSLSGPGPAHADEIMRLCGPRAVGFIRSSAGQTCLYGSNGPALAPAPAKPPAPPPTPTPKVNPSTSAPR